MSAPPDVIDLRQYHVCTVCHGSGICGEGACAACAGNGAVDATPEAAVGRQYLLSVVADLVGGELVDDDEETDAQRTQRIARSN